MAEAKRNSVPRISVDTQVWNPAPQGYRRVEPSLNHIRFVFEVAVRLVAMLGGKIGLDSIRITFSQSAIQLHPHYKIRIDGGLGHTIEVSHEEQGIQPGYKDDEYQSTHEAWGRLIGESAGAIYLTVMQSLAAREDQLRATAELVRDRRLNPKN